MPSFILGLHLPARHDSTCCEHLRHRPQGVRLDGLEVAGVVGISAHGHFAIEAIQLLLAAPRFQQVICGPELLAADSAYGRNGSAVLGVVAAGGADRQGRPQALGSSMDGVVYGCFISRPEPRPMSAAASVLPASAGPWAADRSVRQHFRRGPAQGVALAGTASMAAGAAGRGSPRRLKFRRLIGGILGPVLVLALDLGRASTGRPGPSRSTSANAPP